MHFIFLVGLDLKILRSFLYFSSQLPPELRQQGGNMVQVNMEDHRHEDFKQSTSKSKPFAGKGHTLGRFVNNFMCSSIASATNNVSLSFIFS